MPSPDGRQAIVLSADEKNLILAEMRTMLGSVQGVVDGIANKDMKRVAQAARQSGCVQLLTEGLQARAVMGGVRIVNPFDAMPPMKARRSKPR